MNWTLYVVIAIFWLCMVVGFYRGFIRIIASLGVTVVAIIITMILTPHVATAINALLPIEEMIGRRAVQAMTPNLEDVDLGVLGLEGADLEALGITEERLQEMMGAIELPRQMQQEAIERAPLPEVFRESLLVNNNQAVYEALGVSTFPEYVSVFLSNIVVNILAGLITFLVVTVVSRCILYSLDLLSKIPVLGVANRLGGAAIGLVTGLVIVWVGFLVITLMYNNGIGQESLRQIGDSRILSALYESNILLRWLMPF